MLVAIHRDFLPVTFQRNIHFYQWVGLIDMPFYILSCIHCEHSTSSLGSLSHMIHKFHALLCPKMELVAFNLLKDFLIINLSSW